MVEGSDSIVTIEVVATTVLTVATAEIVVRARAASASSGLRASEANARHSSGRIVDPIAVPATIAAGAISRAAIVVRVTTAASLHRRAASVRMLLVIATACAATDVAAEAASVVEAPRETNRAPKIGTSHVRSAGSPLRRPWRMARCPAGSTHRAMAASCAVR